MSCEITDEQIAEIEARREAFEEWFNYNYKWFITNGHYGYTLERHEDEPCQYVQDQPHHDWRVWQAALDSICVELPKCDPSEVVQYGDALNDFKQSLTAAGVNFK